ncbi:MAG: hypothetical protein IJ975_03160 [Clostridia bacterium]|nr:hypothetical protein [Clostridia bacterium]
MFYNPKKEEEKMVSMTMPYYMENKEWYWIDKDADYCRYKLTDKAPQKAKEDYLRYENFFNYCNHHPQITMKDVDAGIELYKKKVAAGEIFDEKD